MTRPNKRYKLDPELKEYLSAIKKRLKQDQREIMEIIERDEIAYREWVQIMKGKPNGRDS